MRDLTVTSFVRSTSGFIGALVLAAISARTQGQSMVAWGNPGFSNVDNLTDVVGVAAGLDHSVALRANGVVAAWGSDGYQQCNPPSNLGNIIEVSAGEGFTIARRPNGTLVGWGLNQYTQTNVPAITDATAIAAGRVHGMALRANGSVVAWGYAADGATTVPSNLGPVGRIAAGFYHSIALQSDGILRCWGSNGNGQCNAPANLGGVAAISGGGWHTAVATSDGTVRCWGYNFDGQTNVPVSLTGVVGIAGGGYHTVAQLSDGSLRCWGRNVEGQCSIPANLPAIAKVAASELHTVVLTTTGRVVTWGTQADGRARTPERLDSLAEIVVGGDALISRHPDGTLSCWGANNLGQCNVPAGLINVAAIAAGQGHVMALRSNGTIICWGGNANAQCNVPAAAQGAAKIGAGWKHSLAISPSGVVRCWGNNTAGECSPPANVGALSQATGGFEFSMGLRANGTLIGWGRNGIGQLNVPSSLTNAVKVSCGDYHSAALTADGRAVCWGGGVASQSAVPADLGTVVDVQAGVYATVALKADGTVRGWGVTYAGGYGPYWQPAGIANVRRISVGGSMIVADVDACPNDPNKTEPGACGCGVADTDSDSDGVANCNDGCPNDANKTAPGTCGCGVADTDSDGDGVANCIDGCPNDANKTAAGACGCGVADTDSDGDGVANCNDGCPNDANKTSAGTCGCGIADTDSDSDGVANCIDGCPNDANKTAPGTCGCGIADTDSDSDGVANCNDGCPNDANKTAAGACGCGTADIDANGNGVLDCLENCDDSFDLVALTPQIGAHFGAASALRGDWIAIGAPDEAVSGQANAGAVYIYSRIAGAWTATTRLLSPVPAAGARFGTSVAWLDTELSVGAPGEYAGEGQVYAFSRDANGTFAAGRPLEANGPAVETVQFTTDYTGPFDSTHPVSFKLFNLPPAAAEVRLFVDHAADMGASNETYTVNIMSFTTGALRSGTDCTASTDQTAIPASVFNASALTGRFVFLLATNANVDPCANSAVRIRLSYETHRVQAQSAVIAPFDDTHPAVATFTGLRPNLGEVYLQVTRRGDINASNETYQMYLDGTPIGTAVLNPEIGGPECVTITDTRVATAAQFAAALVDGSVTVSAVSLGGIDPCVFSEAQIVVRYAAQHDLELGTSVASDGSNVFAGAPGSQVGGAAAAGSIVKYGPSSTGVGSLVRVARIISPSPLAGERLGSAVAQSGGVVLAGAPRSGALLGSARVFSGSGVPIQYLGAPAGALGFGSALAFGSGELAISAPRETQGGFASAGAVHVYALNGAGQWSFGQRLASPQPASDALFGSSISFAQRVLAIGASGGTGGVYLASASAAGGHSAPQLRDSCTSSFDLGLGSSVAADGRSLVAGAPNTDQASGRARMYLLPAPCVADVFPDGRVDGADLAVLLTRWGIADVAGTADLDGDGIVGGADLSIMLSNWGNCP